MISGNVTKKKEEFFNFLLLSAIFLGLFCTFFLNPVSTQSPADLEIKA